MPTIGPSLPSHLTKRKRSEEASPPPAPSPPSQSSSTSSSAAKRRRVIGPAVPPAPLSERPSTPPSPTHSASSDFGSDFGPSLPPAPGTQAAQQAEQEQIERATKQAAEEASKKPQREEWMLVPPSNSDWSSRVDPTKLKNRKFQTGKGSRAPVSGGGGENAVWTETPEEKRRRLEDEVMGRQKESWPSTGKGGRDGSGGSSSTGHRQGTDGDEERERRVKKLNEKRGGSLLKAHKQAGKGNEEEDDPSKRVFDREKDMGLATKLGEAKKREMVRRAGDFGSRFEKGKYL